MNRHVRDVAQLVPESMQIVPGKPVAVDQEGMGEGGNMLLLGLGPVPDWARPAAVRRYLLWYSAAGHQKSRVK